jgi:hypothetical protein
VFKPHQAYEQLITLIKFIYFHANVTSQWPTAKRKFKGMGINKHTADRNKAIYFILTTTTTTTTNQLSL